MVQKQSAVDHKKFKRFRCWIGFHEWTCAANEGILPTPEQINGGIKGFEDYAKGYCKYCKKPLDIK